ncbi:DUF4062 domain-containing protein [Leptospira sp. WS4.C2]
MNIFISSTIYDLLDLRAEIYDHLVLSGFTVRLSDIDQSDFEVYPDKSAIEICLENVRRSDYFVIILDKRYGKTVENLGYPKISVTHLEYLEAKKYSIPILFYVRDKTLSEFNIFSSNKVKFKFNWINESETGIFSLIENHGKALKKSDNNWIIPFKNSIEIKLSIEKKLRIPYLRKNLARKIAEGEIPIITGTVSSKINGFDFVIKSEFLNTSKFTIFIKKFGYKEEAIDKEKYELFSPNDKKSLTQIFYSPNVGQHKSSNIILEYLTYEGILIKAEYQTNVKLNELSQIIYGIELINRKFEIVKPVDLVFE